MSKDFTDDIKEILVSKLYLLDSLRVNTFGLEDNLYHIGLDSLKMIRMIELLEDKYDISIPEDKINPNDFSSIKSINNLLISLIG